MDNYNYRYQLGLYEKSMPNTLTLAEKLTYTKISGFDFLELSIDESEEKMSRLQWSAKERRELRNILTHLHTPIGSMCLSAHRKYPLGSHQPDMEKKSLEIMQQALLLATDLHIPLIQLAGYDVYYEQSDSISQKKFLSNLYTITEMASFYGVHMAFETMETAFMDTVSKAKHYVDIIQSPYLGIYPDIGNLCNASLLYHTPVTHDLMVGKGSILAAHLKETRPNIYREVPFGTGHTDYDTAIPILKTLGVRRFVGEFWYQVGDNWQETLVQNNQFLKSQLDKYF